MNPRIAFVAAPLLTMAYGVIRILDGLDGSRGPGLAWTTGHLAFLGALTMFVVTFVHMRRMAGSNTLSTVSATIGIVGILSLSAQFVIDMIVGFLSADHAAMGVHFERIQAVPGVLFAVYTVVPVFFFIGQFALATQLAVQRRVKAWTSVLVLLDCVVPNLDKDLMPLGALFLLVAFIPLAGLVSRTAGPAPVAA
ncbi:hypothetical protein [Planotetraspora kaengkrachanensis]|uniref:Uncharacterized protein n=1 Tax=Planotetraspora kaengkrachanensis TaxID=575193 RepID=A0A8J3PTZ9_9ACTN|nr:hypothetical protein [Planotetraspora kaengkrachanensis]GIG81009.1 hypothetical protein Pka01_41360 [Planotetraspora kaengkrachanensis]